MVQINLLPDVKTKYIKAQRSKRLIILSASLISLVAIGALLITAGAYGAQKVVLSQLDSNIDKNLKTLQSTKDLDKVLTIQNQLGALDDLHSQNPVTSRIFDLLQKTTPNDVQISTITLNLTDSTLQITGTANSLIAINKYVDTLKFAQYTTDQAPDQKVKAFNGVVLVSFGTGEKDVAYSVSLKFDPELFNSANKSINMIIDEMITTRSETERPKELFKELPKADGQ